ncbi:hypothetical protein [Halorientalis sp.]|uniref:hypothetical protein n=1 Tax=Halorientalis sp. TaxID=1931229 RepID=UPI0026204947|nr:hypothetical protein [Halorientalis sp.]
MVSRELLSAVLGVGLGLVCLAFPGAVVRINTAGRVPGGRHGEYGDDAVPEKWKWVVRVVGILLLAGGGYFAYTVV